MSEQSEFYTQKTSGTCQDLLERAVASDPMSPESYMSWPSGIVEGLWPGFFHFTVGLFLFALYLVPGLILVLILVGSDVMSGPTAAYSVVIEMIIGTIGLMVYGWRHFKDKRKLQRTQEMVREPALDILAQVLGRLVPYTEEDQVWSLEMQIPEDNPNWSWELKGLLGQRGMGKVWLQREEAEVRLTLSEHNKTFPVHTWSWSEEESLWRGVHGVEPDLAGAMGELVGRLLSRERVLEEHPASVLSLSWEQAAVLGEFREAAVTRVDLEARPRVVCGEVSRRRLLSRYYGGWRSYWVGQASLLGLWVLLWVDILRGPELAAEFHRGPILIVLCAVLALAYGVMSIGGGALLTKYRAPRAEAWEMRRPVYASELVLSVEGVLSLVRECEALEGRQIDLHRPFKVEATREPEPEGDVTWVTLEIRQVSVDSYGVNRVAVSLPVRSSPAVGALEALALEASRVDPMIWMDRVWPELVAHAQAHGEVLPWDLTLDIEAVSDVVDVVQGVAFQGA